MPVVLGLVGLALPLLLLLGSCSKAMGPWSREEFVRKSWIDLEGNFLSKSPYKNYSGRITWRSDDGSRTKMRYEGGRLVGLVESTHPNGNRKEKFRYVDGKKDGQAVWFYPERGKINVVGQYSNGSRVGEWLWYYKEGPLNARGFYVAHALEGLYTVYYREGGVKRTIDYVGGVRHGGYASHYPDGAVKIRGAYSNRLQEGVWLRYSRNGDVTERTTYKEGKTVNTEVFE